MKSSKTISNDHAWRPREDLHCKPLSYLTHLAIRPIRGKRSREPKFITLQLEWLIYFEILQFEILQF